MKRTFQKHAFTLIEMLACPGVAREKRERSQSRSGFTLIEMLVVIAIIAILAGLLFPGISAALNSAKRRQAESIAQNVEGAVMLYFNDYNGKLPLDPAYNANDSDLPTSSPDFTESQAVLEVLMVDSPDTDALNPKQKVYLSTEVSSDDGTLLDPWGNQFYLILDRNYDGAIEYLTTAGEAHRKRVLVVSPGRDGDFGSGTNEATQDNVANVQLDN